jgi:Rrf2 family protein
MLLDIAFHMEKGPIRTQDIAEREQLPLKYLEKLVRLLKNANIVSSKRGPGGGHKLIKEPKSITLGELIRVLEGKEKIIDCHDADIDLGTKSSCAAHIFWDKVNGGVTSMVDEVTLADIMKEADKHHPARAEI